MEEVYWDSKGGNFTRNLNKNAAMNELRVNGELWVKIIVLDEESALFITYYVMYYGIHCLTMHKVLQLNVLQFKKLLFARTLGCLEF